MAASDGQRGTGVIELTFQLTAELYYLMVESFKLRNTGSIVTSIPRLALHAFDTVIALNNAKNDMVDIRAMPLESINIDLLQTKQVGDFMRIRLIRRTYPREPSIKVSQVCFHL